MTINLSMPVTHELRPRITVVGVGGAGTNAVNNMITSHLEGVEFVSCNTDAQSLTQCLTERRIQLGASITQGLGAGARPEIGRAAAEEAIEDILDQLEGSHMVFITAGMGGGTGTGAAPVIARAVREQGILTVGVVTKPFHFEGAHRMRVAEGGLKELQEYVDTLIVIPNQNLFRIANERTTFADAFKLADNVLHMGVRGVTDLMVMPGLINLDFADIRTVMSEMGKAMMGTGEGSGERRAVEASEAAISNPLLDDVSMRGARGVLINITGGPDMTLFEVDEAANRIKEEVDPDANIIVGSTLDELLEGNVRVSVVATGIELPTRSERAPRAEAAAKPDSQPEQKPAEMPAAGGTGPSFRLRPQSGKMPALAGGPPKAPAGGTPSGTFGQRAEQRFGAIPAMARREWTKPEPRPADSPDEVAQPENVELVGAEAPDGPPNQAAPHPAVPPQDRVSEWSEVRTPAREVVRGPSLFERVTQSITRSLPERPETEPKAPAEAAPAGGNGFAPARQQEDDYEIPAFLRR